MYSTNFDLFASSHLDCITKTKGKNNTRAEEANRHHTPIRAAFCDENGGNTASHFTCSHHFRLLLVNLYLLRRDGLFDSASMQELCLYFISTL